MGAKEIPLKSRVSTKRSSAYAAAVAATRYYCSPDNHVITVGSCPESWPAIGGLLPPKTAIRLS